MLTIARVGSVLLAVSLLPAVLPAAAGTAAAGTGTAAADTSSVQPRAKAPSTKPRGSLEQLPGAAGCVVDQSVKNTHGCATARALKGPGPFMGSRALALSPDGRHLYVASSSSDAITVFARNPRTGALRQAQGKAGCVSLGGSNGCGDAAGLDGPNSIAISKDGDTVYATSRDSNSVTAFSRNSSSGALTQLTAGGCVAGGSVSGCSTGIALSSPDVVVVSDDGRNVYVGSFTGNAVAAFSIAADGGLSQLAGTAACIAEATSGCATGIALKAPEGLAIAPGGATVYVGSAVSNAIAVLTRDSSTGALSQAADGSGCVVNSPLTGCTTGRQLAGANAIALSRDGRSLYATSLFSSSITAFDRSPSGSPIQKAGFEGCVVNLGAASCQFGRAMAAPEGLVVSPDGRSVYVTAFASGAIDVLDRNKRTGDIMQKGKRLSCVAKKQGKDCTKARAMKGVSSVVVSSDSRFVYSTAFGSNAVTVFSRRR